MANSQLEWLKAATGDVKVFRAMVVGAQTVLDTLNATVLRFNRRYFAQTDDQHREAKIIAAKQAVIASLRELRLMLDAWNTKLHEKGALSQKTIDMRKQARQTLDRIHQFKHVRNCAFHFGDPVENPDKLVELYEYVEAFDLDDLNNMLTTLYDLVLQMRQDALAAEQRERQTQPAL